MKMACLALKNCEASGAQMPASEGSIEECCRYSAEGGMGPIVAMRSSSNGALLNWSDCVVTSPEYLKFVRYR